MNSYFPIILFLSYGKYEDNKSVHTTKASESRPNKKKIVIEWMSSYAFPTFSHFILLLALQTSVVMCCFIFYPQSDHEITIIINVLNMYLQDLLFYLVWTKFCSIEYWLNRNIDNWIDRLLKKRNTCKRIFLFYFLIISIIYFWVCLIVYTFS